MKWLTDTERKIPVRLIRNLTSGASLIFIIFRGLRLYLVPKPLLGIAEILFAALLFGCTFAAAVCDKSPPRRWEVISAVLSFVAALMSQSMIIVVSALALLCVSAGRFRNDKWIFPLYAALIVVLVFMQGDNYRISGAVRGGLAVTRTETTVCGVSPDGTRTLVRSTRIFPSGMSEAEYNLLRRYGPLERAERISDSASEDEYCGFITNTKIKIGDTEYVVR